MSEDDRKSGIQSQCWKTIFIAIALLAIGAVIGHLLTVRCPHCRMMGRCGDGYGMKAPWGKGGPTGRCEFGDKLGYGRKFCDKQGKWTGCREKMGMCKPGCTCPKCSKKGACLSEDKKGVCPMMDKKMVKTKTKKD
jgi:hypothetical protein